MDPVSHLVCTALLVGRAPRTLVAGVAPDLPWYILYPAWLLARPEARRAARAGAWPLPPEGIRQVHYAAHSLLVAGLCGLALRRRSPARAWLWAWALHILLDMPTHARARMAPRPLWPLSAWTLDGLSWADLALSGLRRIVARWRGR
ncbi:MAG: hypothetical protein V1772_00475 [Chloroflexota bacterium]